MPANPVRWFEIYVDDIQRAKKFYEAVFGFKLEKLPTPPALNATEMELWTLPSDMEREGTSGALVKMRGVNPGGTGTIVYFSSEDCSIEEKRVVKSGGKIERTKTPIGEYGFIILAIDTEGNLIGIHSLK